MSTLSNIFTTTMAILHSLFPASLLDEVEIDTGDSVFEQMNQRDAKSVRNWLTDIPFFGMFGVDAKGYLVDSFGDVELVFTGTNVKVEERNKVNIRRLNAFFKVGEVGSYSPNQGATLSVSIITFDDPHKEPVIKGVINTWHLEDEDIRNKVISRLSEFVTEEVSG